MIKDDIDAKGLDRRAAIPFVLPVQTYTPRTKYDRVIGTDVVSKHRTQGVSGFCGGGKIDLETGRIGGKAAKIER